MGCLCSLAAVVCVCVCMHMRAHVRGCLTVFVSMGLFCVYLNVLVIMYFHMYVIHPCVSVYI